MLSCVYRIVGEFGDLFYPNIDYECVKADQYLLWLCTESWLGEYQKFNVQNYRSSGSL